LGPKAPKIISITLKPRTLMSPNFSQSLLKQDLSSVPKPTVLPSGVAYPMTLAKYEFRKLKTKDGGEANILTYTAKFNDWSPEIPESERVDHQGEPLDITSKSARMDYFVDNERGRYDLAQLLLGLGLGGSLEEAIPMAIGAQVLGNGEQKLIEKNNEIVFNLKGLKAA